MPVRSRQSDLVRIVVGRRGRVAMESEGVLRFDYGASVPWVTLSADRKSLRAVAGPDMALLCSPVPLENRERKTFARFDVGAGETLRLRAHARRRTSSVRNVDAAEGARRDRGVLEASGARAATSAANGPRRCAARSSR